MDNVIETKFNELLALMKERHGSIKYKYRKVQHSYRRGEHWVSCIEHPEVSKEEYYKNIDETSKLSGKAFFGKLKQSYCDYRIEADGISYLDILREMVKEETKKAIENDRP